MKETRKGIAWKKKKKKVLQGVEEEEVVTPQSGDIRPNERQDRRVQQD
jgi:hypothetical protein